MTVTKTRDTKTQLQTMSVPGLNGTMGVTGPPEDQTPALSFPSWADNLMFLPLSVKQAQHAACLSAVMTIK